MNELDVQKCKQLIGLIAQQSAIIAEQFILGLILITKSINLLDFFIANGKVNNRQHMVDLADKRKKELLGIGSNTEEYDVD